MRDVRQHRQGAAASNAARAALVTAVVASQVTRAAGASPLWLASLPAVPVLTYTSWLAMIRTAWDVSHTVTEEAKESVRTIGSEVRGMAESASFEVRGWITTFGMPIRGALYLAALFLGTFALWMLVAELRKFWPTWPSPYDT